MPGYRLVGVDKNNLDTKYLCSLCGELLRDAVQTKCGHFYCKSCLEQCLENSTTPFDFCCAKDGKVLQKNQIFEDRFIRREILALMVFCTFKDEGCTWRGEVRHFEDHEAACEFMKVSCVYGACGSLVKRGDLVHHLTTECSCRPQKCRFCGKEISCNLMKKHLRTNHNYLHYEMDNLRDGVDDVLHVLENLRDEQRGLQYGQRDLRDGQRHLRDGVQNAMRQLQECLAGQGNLQNRQDDLQNAVRVVQETIAELIRSYDDQKMEGDFITDKLANLEDKLNKALLTFDGRAINGNAERTLALGSRESGSVEMQVENTQETPVLLVESVRRLERRIESIEHTLALRDEKMRQLEEFSSSDGQYLWKISDYAHKRNDAVTGQQVSFYSPCFFTSRYGYKMRAQLYLNGDGMGRGTHISVFFVVMHGQYDALLRWPFRQKVTFMLLDQDNVEHVSEAFRPDPSSSSFQRPKREANIASGCPTFCSQAELNNHAYVRDDTMFLKIIVDTSDL